MRDRWRAVDPSVAGVCVAMIAVAAAMGPAGGAPAWVLGVYGLMFAPYGWLVWSRRRLDGSELWVIAATALVIRALLVWFEPVLSDDIFRYVWDGRVAAAGINPFEYPPASEALSSVRDAEVWPAINHPEVPTIYPPVAQGVFELNAHLGGGVTGMKAWLVAIESTAAALCVWRSRRGGASWSAITSALAVYALNPLVFMEVAHSGHVDVLAWSLLAVALVVWRYPSAGRGWWRSLCVAVLVGLSVGAKFLSLAVLPFLLADAVRGGGAGAVKGPMWRGMVRGIVVCAVAVGVVALTYVPYAGVGTKVFGGFGTYAATWRSNDGGYRIVQSAAAGSMRRAMDCSEGGKQDGDAGGRARGVEHMRCASGEPLLTLEGLNEPFMAMGWTKTWRGKRLPDTTWSVTRLSGTVAKGAAVLVVGLVCLGAVMLRASPAAGLVAVLVALYLFAPVVHPWYVAWLVPLSVLSRKRVGLVFSVTVMLGYTAWWSAQTGGEWHVPSWVVAVEYLPVMAAAWWDVVEGETSG